MKQFRYEVTSGQLKNRHGILRSEFLAVQRYNNGSGNNPFPNEPSYMELLVQTFSKKHNAVPPVLSSSDNGIVISENMNAKSAKRTIMNDDAQSSESEGDDDPVTPATSKPNDKKRNTKTPPSTAKVLTQVNLQLEDYSKQVAINRETFISLFKQDVDDAKKYREESLKLKKEVNIIRNRKYKLLKKLLEK